MRKLFLVVPCFNEAEMLPTSVPRMLEVLDELSDEAKEEGSPLETSIILSDDGSTDDTAEVIRSFGNERIQHLSLKHSGQQGALLGGLRAALEQGADAVITLDADLQDDPAAIPEMVRKWQQGKEVVYGVRDSRGNDSPFKKASARFFYALMHLADRRHIIDHAEFRLMDRCCIEKLLDIATPKGDIIRNIVPTLGFESDIVYYSRGKRSAGESKYNLAKMLALSWKGLASQAPFWMLLTGLFTFIAFFLTSVDSPLHDSMVAHNDYIRNDSAWYFMGGKAWMNGLIPYVDFADSKGPLLWLFYALAYLLSPRSWIGVFWINALAYAATSAILFRVSLLLTRSPKKSFLIGVLLNAVYFLPLLIFDDKSEAIALPFVALGLLAACRSLWGKGGSFFEWGFAFGAILLIKYSVAAMTLIFLVAMLVSLKGWKSFFKAAGAALAGFAVVVGPMMLYFLRVGAADEFINEYFITTFSTINNIVGSNDKGEFLRYEMVGYLSLAIAGAITAIFALDKNEWFPPAALAWFLLCLSGYARTYYYIPANALMVFTMFGILRCFDKEFGWKRYIFGPILLGAVVFLGISNRWSYKSDYFNGRHMNVHRERAKAFIELVAREHRPRVLYWGCSDHGYGIKAEDLPACKYWALQAGCTQEMLDDQEKAVKEQLADFVFVNSYDWQRLKKLKEYGYHPCHEPRYGTYRAFSKEEY